MVWTVIPDSDIDPDSPITTGLMTGYRNNIIESSPTGMIIDWPFAIAPSGFLPCNGAAISRTAYAALFAVAGTTYGIGDGSTTFNIPDRQGEHVRGWDNGAGRDPDRASRTDRGDGTVGDNVGTKQGHMYQSHAHGGVAVIHSDIQNQSIVDGGQYASTAGSTSAAGGNETRGRNVYTNYCIRYSGF